MFSSSLTYFLLLVVIVLIYFLFRNQPQPGTGTGAGNRVLEGPVSGTDITMPGNALKKWDCSNANRQIVLSDVPSGLTPYLYPFNETELRKQPLEGFNVLISIAADIRFRNADAQEVDELDTPVKMWLSYNAQDILELQKNGHTVDDLVPVKIVPGRTGWRRFAEGSVDYGNIKCGELGGVYITIKSWGDPPTGWGTPK